VSVLLVASTGGHLKQLHRLRDRIPEVGPDPLWVTFDSPQSRALLEGERVEWALYVGSRNPGRVARNTALGARILRTRQYDRIVSTGSAIALSFMPLGRAMGIDCHFIESAARGAGPSVTGRIISRVPGMHLYTQYPSWASERWRYAGSVMDGFRAEPGATPAEVRRVVVLLGTMEHGFRRLVDSLLRVLPPEAEVLWQTGSTDVSGLGIEARETVPGNEIDAAVREADVVVAHAGIGAALTTLEAGRAPLLVPRLARHGEHSDDHQTYIATDLSERGLAVSRDADDLTPEDLSLAAGLRVSQVEALPEFRLR
jgi:UDP-N-acetylglucosamine--N-acetylmuramyl-(pentapeptide) pyrophosphoryl-undecaprenol N-acetylglucosamine transferase